MMTFLRPAILRRTTALSLCASAAAVALFSISSAGAQTPAYSSIIVFGDSLSDVGNLRDRMEDRGVAYPGGEYNYSDGRLTNSSDTDPASDLYEGVWHEQLSRTFLNRSAETRSLDGGNVFAFGGATTRDGQQDYSIIDFFGNDITVTIDNMGKQVDDYLAGRTVDANALYVVWGGGNDLFDDDSEENVTGTSARMAMLISRLANAGAREFLVPNVPPLGAVPRYEDDRETQDAKNTASLRYRTQLDADLNSVAATLAGQGINVVIHRMDVWSLSVRFAANPAAYGFVDISNNSKGEDVDPDEYLFWDDIHPTTAGHYYIAREANRVLSGADAPPARAVNVSTRVTVSGGENVAIGGFIITGSEPKRVLIRGIGPSLSEQGVNGPLPDPFLRLMNGNGTQIRMNNDWQDSQPVAIAATGIPPTDDRESAIVRTLQPGEYTAILSGNGAVSGVGLIEVYDLNSSGASTLANLSTRGAVGTGDEVMIGGVIIENGDDPIVVVRAIGPSLAAAGVTNPLLDPMLELYDSNGTIIGSNDEWKDGQPTAAKATLLAPQDDRESTLVASLAPGNYTAVVRGKGGTTGVALVEVFRLP